MCFALTLFYYKTERDSRLSYCLESVGAQERRQRHSAELAATRKEAQLMNDFQSGFSQLHHVLKNILVSVQNVLSSGTELTSDLKNQLILACEDGMGFIRTRQVITSGNSQSCFAHFHPAHQIFVDVARQAYTPNPTPTHLPSFFDSLARAHGVSCTPMERAAACLDTRLAAESALLKAILVVGTYPHLGKKIDPTYRKCVNRTAWLTPRPTEEARHGSHGT